MASLRSRRARLARHATPLSLGLVGVWALALYIHIMPLPFFRDDMVMLLWLQNMDWGRLWVDATGFLYYRPLSFSTLKLSELFFGYYHAPFLHVVNLFFHTANCVMVAMLTRTVFAGVRARHAPTTNHNGEEGAARRAPTRTHVPTVAGLTAGLLFAAYPFTYEVVPTTGPIFQLQAAFFGLAASLSYAKWREIRLQNTATRIQHPEPRAEHPAYRFRSRWLYLTLAMALMGAFTCEYGVIIPAMIGLTELILWWQDPTRGPGRYPDLRVPLLCLIFTALYLALWFAVPKARGDELPTVWLRELDLKGLYYFQGMTYPAQWAALPLERVLNPGAPLFTEPAPLPEHWSWVVAGLGAAALAGLVTVFARGRRWDALAFGMALWGLAAVPTWATLKWEYTWNGPRLLYLPAMGAALLWGGALGRLIAEDGPQTHPYRRWSQVIGVALLVMILGQSALFLRAEAEVAHAGGKAVDDTVAAITALPEDESALVVNFPSWLRPRERTYILGTEGISFLPAYSTVTDLVELNGRAIRNTANLTFTNLWNPWKFEQRFYTAPVNWDELLPALRSADHVFLFRFDDDGAHLYEAGNVRPAEGAAGESFIAAFDQYAQLDDASYTLEGEQLMVALEWASHGSPGMDWTVFLHLYDEDGRWLADGDGYPLLGLLPLWTWEPGERVHDLRYIDLPADLPAGRYRVGCGVYDVNTDERIPPIDAGGAGFPNNVVPLFEFDYPGNGS